MHLRYDAEEDYEMSQSSRKSDPLFNLNLSRRELLRGGVAFGFATTWAAHEFGLGPSLYRSMNQLLLQTSGHSLGSYWAIQDALAGGPSLLRWFAAREALAVGAAAPWSVVHIKVVNHVATPLVFRLGQRTGNSLDTFNESDTTTPTLIDGVDVSADMFRNIVNPACQKYLSGAGLGKLSGLSLGLTGTEAGETYGSKYRMNGWFASMLDQPSSVLNAEYPATFLQATGKFDHNAVGLTCALGLDQTRGGNHSLLNLKLRADKPDIGFYLQDKGILTSPLGITAFMMGTEYDCAEGSSKVNGVLKSYADDEAAAVRGVSVKVQADSIVQSIENSRAGYTAAATEGSLTDRFDKLVSSEPALRRSMEAAKAQFAQEVSGLVSEADPETTKVKPDFTVAAGLGMVQATGTGVPNQSGSRSNAVDVAQGEFLAQTGYTCRMLGLEGRPVRNFSLFLNMTDSDGGPADTAYYGAPAGNSVIRCVSYVEGMRQLAVGLNMLSQAIKNHGNIVVVVTSEGGRGARMLDSKVSFGMVMGPKSAVGSSLIADMNAINNKSSLQTRNPGSAAAEHTMPLGMLLSPNGSPLAGVANVGDMQAGVVRILAQQIGYTGSLTELGNYLKLR
jgi:hypothetical protein